MANSKTVYFPIEISYTGADNSVEVLSFNLTLSLSLEPGAENSTCGEITVNGAIMPIEDPKGIPTPEVNSEPDALPKAA